MKKSTAKKTTKPIKLPNSIVSLIERRNNLVAEVNAAELEKIEKFYHLDLFETKTIGCGIGFREGKLVSFKYSKSSQLEWKAIGLKQALEELLEIKTTARLLEIAEQHEDEGEIKFFELVRNVLLKLAKKA